MAARDIIVIGASAGGLAAFRSIVGALPPDLPAALVIVQHLAPSAPSLLAELLSRSGPLPARQPVDGETIPHGMIFVAPPDQHLLIQPGHFHLVRGPKENGFRPAIDATMRSAALAYGPRVSWVILTGMLDDGTAGLLAVKRQGGFAIVQDPHEAPYPSMPVSASRYVDVDLICPVAAIAAHLRELVTTAADMESASTMVGQMDEQSERELRISALDRAAIAQSGQMGVPSTFSCPDCGGVLVEYYDGDLLRHRCQTGHVYSPASFLAQQGEELEHALWAAFRALNERVSLADRLAAEAQRQNDTSGAQRFSQLRAQAAAQQEWIHQLLQRNGAEQPRASS
jgi:two-component system, chemotaxis family, protein-glutamate methylesterase/glutaminase